MVYIHFALLFACIIYAAKLGGIGVGMAGEAAAGAVTERLHHRCSLFLLVSGNIFVPRELCGINVKI